MGVEWEDCDVVAKLLGIKTFLNEFVAYADLSTYIKNRQTMNGLRTISVSVALLSYFSWCFMVLQTWVQSFKLRIT